MNTSKRSQPSQISNGIAINDFYALIKLSKKMDNQVEAFRYATKANELAQDNQRLDQIAESNLVLTNILIDNGAFNDAIIKNERALNYYQEENQKTEEAECWQYMATIYKSLNDFDKELTFREKYLTIIKESNQPIRELQSLNAIGEAYLNINRFDEAINIFENNATNAIANVELIGVSLKNIAQAHLLKQNDNIAKLKFEGALAFAEKNNLEEIIKICFHNLGAISLANNNIEGAVHYFEKALNLCKGIPCLDHENLTTLEHLLMCNFQLKEVDKAAEYFNQYQNLQERINEKTNSNSNNNIQFRIAIDGIERPCKLLEQKNVKLIEAKNKIEAQREILQYKSQQLEEVNQELKDFAYIVSHDIKEPIRTVTNFSKLLKMEMGDTATPNAKEYLDFIQTASKRMTTFVGDVLSYSTAEKTDRPAEMVDCNMVLKQIELNVNKRLEETKGQLIYTDLPYIRAHRSLMLQIFQNLISNALKFSKPDVPPVVKVSGVEIDNKIIYKIEDNGIGIKAEHQDKVFDLFQRLNNRSEYEGSGIGLSTVVKVLRKYNGTIDLESEFGKGTTFTISFPKYSEEILTKQ